MNISKGLNAVFGKAALASAALGAMLVFAGAPAARAADRDDCAKRIHKAEYKLNEAIDRHGYYSKQAGHWRHERREAFRRCDRYGYGYRDRDRDDRYRDRYDRDYRY